MGLFFKSRREKEMEKLEHLIYRADQDEPGARDALYDAIDRLNVSDDYPNIRDRFYQRLAKQGDAFAELQVGISEAMSNNGKSAFAWYTKSAEHGNAEAMYALGYGYTMFKNSDGEHGWGYQPEKMLYWMQKAWDGGCTNAAKWIADAYANGYGVEENDDMAVSWLKKGADAGDYGCRRDLADDYYDYPLKPKYYNKVKAVEVLEQNMRTDDRDRFEMTALSLAYKYNRIACKSTADTDPSYNVKKAAYCATLAYVLSDDHDPSQLQGIPYRVSQDEFDRWKMDAVNLRYNIEKI